MLIKRLLHSFEKALPLCERKHTHFWFHSLDNTVSLLNIRPARFLCELCVSPLFGFLASLAVISCHLCPEIICCVSSTFVPFAHPSCKFIMIKAPLRIMTLSSCRWMTSQADAWSSRSLDQNRQQSSQSWEGWVASWNCVCTSFVSTPCIKWASQPAGRISVQLSATPCVSKRRKSLGLDVFYTLHSS